MKKAARVTRVVLLSIVLSCLVSMAALGQSHDIAWTFGDVGFSAYRPDAFTPADAGLGTLGSQNPTLALELGTCEDLGLP